jgi:hypothetical protein
MFINTSGSLDVNVYNGLTINVTGLPFTINTEECFIINSDDCIELNAYNDIAITASHADLTLNAGTNMLINVSGNQTTSVSGAMAISASGGLTINNNTTILGDLTVTGQSLSLNVETVTVDDNNITLNDVATPTDSNASGGGITLLGSTTSKTISWDPTCPVLGASSALGLGAWNFNQHVDIDVNLGYHIDCKLSLNRERLIIAADNASGGIYFNGRDGMAQTPLHRDFRLRVSDQGIKKCIIIEQYSTSSPVGWRITERFVGPVL